MAQQGGPRGWLEMALGVVREGGPITLLLTIVLGGVVIYGLVGEVRRVHEVNLLLWDKLLQAQQAQIDLALRCDCAGKDSR
jgi:hypothetical protein